MIRLISTDFDGTLHNFKTVPPIAPELLEWIARVQKNGVKWVINTGRNVEDVLQTFETLQLPITPDYVVSIERNIHRVYREGYYEDHSLWNANCIRDHQQLFNQSKQFLRWLSDWVQVHFKVESFEDPWSPLCIVASSPLDADKIHLQIKEQCRAVTDLAVVRNAQYFRFGHSRYSKGTALAEIARVIGISKQYIFAAGDHYNDISMLDGIYASYVAAPSNAVEEVKTTVIAAGGYVAKQPCGLGVLEALDFFESPQKSKES